MLYSPPDITMPSIKSRLTRKQGETMDFELIIILGRMAEYLTQLNTKVDKLMSQDASIAAAATDLEAQVATLTAAFASMSSAFAVLQAEIAAGTASVSQATMDALAKAQADIDAVAVTGAADAASETAAAPPPA